MTNQDKGMSKLGYAAVLVLFGALGVGAFMLQASREPAPLELEQAIEINPARNILWSELIAQDNSVFTPEHIKGKWTFLYMGYRSCPDACPVAMAVLGKTANGLSDLKLPTAQQPQFVFMSVDPRRDTPELMAEYVAFFGEKFLGVTGDSVQLRAISLQLGAVFYVPEEPETDNYEVGHSDSIFLMNPEGRLRAILRPPHNPEMIIRNYQKLVD
ncbi:MAG: SCO family protein [Pseudomonadales bacterium]|nr:SCO family protein [Pseudomonadales bacterium]